MTGSPASRTSGTFVPANRPEMARPAAEELLRAGGWDPARDPVALLMRRGYYGESMGGPGNDRNVYDDALLLVGPGVYAAFNANADPSPAPRVGLGTLEAGLWRYKRGIHGLTRPKADQVLAWVQAAPVVLRRHATDDYPAGSHHAAYGESLGEGRWKGWFGVNIHPGGRYTSTNSLACQTVPPDQWPAFDGLLDRTLHRAGARTFPLVVSNRYADP